MAEKLQRGILRYQPADVPVRDDRRRVRGAQVRIEAGGEVLDTTVIPPEGDGPAGWIGEARRVEDLYERGLITIKLALVEAAKEGALGNSATIELGPDGASEAASTAASDGAVASSSAEGHPAGVGPSSTRAIPLEQLARWRREAAGLDKLASRDTDRRARVSVIDVSVVLELLDEVDRLRRELAIHAHQDQAGPIPAEALKRWRIEAEAAESNPETWKLADRLLAAIDEIEGRRSGAAAALRSRRE